MSDSAISGTVIKSNTIDDDTLQAVKRKSITEPKRNSRKAKRRYLVKQIILLLVAPVSLITLWEIGGNLGYINNGILPSPHKLVNTTLHLIENGKLGMNLAVSGIRVVQGFAIGAAGGIMIGLAMGLSRTINRILSSLVGVLRPIPMIAWIPLLILWLGIDEESKIAVIVIGSFWPVLLNTIHGIQSVDQKLLEVTKILEKSTGEVLLHVIIPSALPSIFTGIRLGMGTAWTCVVAAEMIAASKGIGYMITYAREISQPNVVLVGVLSIGIVGLLIDTIILRLQIRLLRWN